MTTPPSGFHAADRLQQKSFDDTGSIPGASKVTIAGGTLFTRLRPPHSWTPDLVQDYKDGWEDGKDLAEPRTSVDTDDWQDSPYIAGYRDAAENRMKWHMAHCPDHGDHEGGCGA